MTQRTVTVNDQGRVVVPVELRRELDIRPGASLVAYAEAGRLVFEDRAHMVRRLQETFRAHNGAGRSVVDELIAERRADAASESDT